MNSTFRVSPSDKRELQKVSRRGSTPTKVSRRCRILLLLHRGLGVDETAAELDCGTATVKRVRRHYRADGMARAIYDAPRSGRPAKYSRKDDKELIALACTDPPDGRARWTIRLLAAKTKRSFGSVQQVLEADGLKPWREKNVVHSGDHTRISNPNDRGPRSV